jgi:hypothetical protein
MIYELQQTRGAAETPLSNEQKRKLAAMAHYAYKEVAPEHQDFDDWRHDEVGRVVGKRGLRDCVNADYLPLNAHFLNLCGNVKGAFRAALRAVTEPREWAYSALLKAVDEAADVLPGAMGYARGFVKNKRGVSLEDADAKTIWHAVFTVRRKAQSLRKGAAHGSKAEKVEVPF